VVTADSAYGDPGPDVSSTDIDNVLHGGFVVWDGELRTDERTLAEAADDFGHIVHARPAAVLAAGSARDVAQVVRSAAEQATPVVARGMGHSSFGQCQVAGGIVVDLRGLADVGPVTGSTITVEAGASWRSVLTATLRHGLTPPVLTDYLGLSVGGTLSVGGIGGTSHRYGLHTDTVERLEVVTDDGRHHTCSPDHEPELFHAVLGGLGRHGIITAATLRLVPAPTTVLRYQRFLPSVTALTSGQRDLLRAGRVDFLQGQVLPGETGWQYLLEVATYDERPLPLPDAEVERLDYVEFADRLAAGEAYLRTTGEWFHPHPWWNAFLPDSTTDRFVTELVTELTPADLGRSGLALVYPIHTAALTNPFPRTPAEPVAFLVGLLRTSPPDPAAVRRAVAGNQDWQSRAAAVGGTAYPVGTVLTS
jgi:FAD/FMN-containing dehydrogenase